MTFTLRAYESADFEALGALDRECFPRGIAYSGPTLRWYLSRPGADCLVAHATTHATVAIPAFLRATDSVPVKPHHANLAGFIMAEARGPEAHIVTLDVSEAYRRSGAGTALLREMERRLAARGVESVALETATNNEAGVAFWQRHGYRTVRILRRYYLDRLDAYFMLKQLASA